MTVKAKPVTTTPGGDHQPPVDTPVTMPIDTPITTPIVNKPVTKLVCVKKKTRHVVKKVHGKRKKVKKVVCVKKARR